MLFSRGNSVRIGIACLLLAALATGCGTIFGGTTQNVRVASSPNAAQVNVPAGATYTTPTTLDLKRKNEYVLTISKEGYETREVEINNSLRGGMLALDILFTGLVGVVVDAATGGWYSLNPTNVDVSLARASNDPSVGPETIEVQLNSIDGVLRVDSDKPVKVRVEKVEE